MKQTLIRQELLVAIGEVAREKGIDRERVFGAIEEAFVKAAEEKYGAQTNITCTIDKKTGEISLFQVLEVVDDPEDSAQQISLEQAQKINPDARIGETLTEPLPSIDFKRISAHIMGQVAHRLIREATKEKEYNDYKEKVGEIVTGSVKSAGNDSIVVDLGQGEGIILRSDMIPRETFKHGDRVRSYIREVKSDPRGYQILLSRAHPLFMEALFKQEVPEIYNGIIEIKAIARDPGSRAKIGVASSDPSLDPVGSCVGVRGNRVQAVTKELQDERIDIIRWSEDPFTFLVNALTPAAITKIIAGHKENAVQVVVPDDQLSLAIGRRGQNVRLASQLLGFDIDILTESQELEKRTESTNKIIGEFTSLLGIDDVLARFLAAEGFESVADIALASPQELSALEGLGEEDTLALHKKAQNVLKAQRAEKQKAFKEMGGEEALFSFDARLAPDHLLSLGNNGVLTLQNFADLASDEILDILGDELDLDTINELVLNAREICMPEVANHPLPDVGHHQILKENHQPQGEAPREER